MTTKFEIYKDKPGEFRFRLVVDNVQIVAVSDSYTSKEKALKGIASVKENAAKTAVEDKTVRGRNNQ